MNTETECQVSSHGISKPFVVFQKAFSEQLIGAVGNEKIRIRESSISVVISTTTIIANAAVDGLATIDMIQYENGVLTNLVYINSTDSSLVPGLVHYIRTSITVDFGGKGFYSSYTSPFPCKNKSFRYYMSQPAHEIVQKLGEVTDKDSPLGTHARKSRGIYLEGPNRRSRHRCELRLRFTRRRIQ